MNWQLEDRSNDIYRDPNEVLRRAHNYLVLRDIKDSGDYAACNLLWGLHVQYFIGELTR